MSSRKLIPTQSWKLIQFSQSQNYENWGPPLTLAQYQDRERICYLHKLCNLQRDWKVDKRGAVYWVMSDDSLTAAEVNDNDDDELKKFVCAAETLIREAWVLNPNSSGIENCQAGVVGSVYTFTKHRSKGYASSMLFDIPVKLKEKKAAAVLSVHQSSKTGATMRHRLKVEVEVEIVL